MQLAGVVGRSEVGRVKCRKVGRRQYRFVLVALGPNGRYTAELNVPRHAGAGVDSTRGRRVGGTLDDASSDAFNALASALWQQGSEPTGLG